MSGFTDASELTRDYHQTVLRLTHEFPSTKVAWDVSQHVLDRLWKSSNGSSSEDYGPAPSSESAGTNIIHACQGCGHHLYPGWKGTSLRVKRPTPFSSPAAKRTLRRREQRKRRKAVRNEAMKARDIQATRRRSSTEVTNVATSTSTAASATSKPRLVLLSDDPGVKRLVRNHLVLTCGRCEDKTYLKGLRRTPQQQQQSKPTPIASKSYRPKASASLASTTGAGNGDLSENFVSVPKLSKTKPPPPQRAVTVPKPVERLSLLQQKQKMQGKKKKKKPGNQPSHMLDFLSSLNDH